MYFFYKENVGFWLGTYYIIIIVLYIFFGLLLNLCQKLGLVEVGLS